LVRQPQITLTPIRFPIVKPGDKLAKVVRDSLQNQGLRPHLGDTLAVASKIVSTCENRIVNLGEIHVTNKARSLANRWRIDERLATLVAREADEIIGGVPGFLLTSKNGILTPNAGIDLKNSPPGTATLWPIDPDRSARLLRRSLEQVYRNRVGVEIVDSHVTALRLGTVGLAIGVSGFAPIRDDRGVRDLFGRTIRVTQTNIADDIAAAAHMIMGESTERIGAVLIRGGAITRAGKGSGESAKLSRRRCLIGNSLAKPMQ
jgi:coenzyme F420-0:L-glutamate ligase